MSYNLEFDERALKEWRKLGATVREQFKKKLAKIIENPHIENNCLHGELSNCYKIKLRASGYRLVYQVLDDVVVWCWCCLWVNVNAVRLMTMPHSDCKTSPPIHQMRQMILMMSFNYCNK